MPETEPPEAGQRVRWDMVCAEIAATPAAYFTAIVTTRALGQPGLAEAFAGFALERFADSVELQLEYCRSADRRAAHDEAAHRWLAATQRAPHHPALPYGLADALMRHGRHGEAADHLASAMRTFASNFHAAAADGWVKGLAVQSAACAGALGHHADAVLWWTALAERFPGDAQIEGQRQAAIARAKGPDPGGAPPTDAAIPAEHLMVAFEGLGDSCEFGLLQRHFGVEPLGLLRWVSIAAGPLLAMLEGHFAGIGDPLNTTIYLHPSQEYITTDTKYGMAMHTFINAEGQDEAKLLAQICRRSHFLARKLIEDLQAGEKIFVYRGSSGLPLAEIHALDRAIKAYNPNNAVLCVSIPAAGQGTGHLERLGPRLFLGAIPCGRRVPVEAGWDVDTAAWQDLLARTYAAFKPATT